MKRLLESSLSSLHAVLASTAWIWQPSCGVVGPGHNRGGAGMDGDGRDADDVVGVVEPIKKRVGGPSSWAALFFATVFLVLV